MSYRSCFYLVGAALLLALSSCHKLHWQRSKIRVRQHPEKLAEGTTPDPEKPTLKVTVVNRTPYIFDSTFTEHLQVVCEKEFARLGYDLRPVDSPDYVARIRVDMDSFAISGANIVGMGGPSSFWRLYRKEKVYAILFDYQLFNTRFRTTKWEERNDIYYFNDTKRNSRRSTSMVKYTIRYGG